LLEANSKHRTGKRHWKASKENDGPVEGVCPADEYVYYMNKETLMYFIIHTMDPPAFFSDYHMLILITWTSVCSHNTELPR
jgi:hypothetical protein